MVAGTKGVNYDARGKRGQSSCKNYKDISKLENILLENFNNAIKTKTSSF